MMNTKPRKLGVLLVIVTLLVSSSCCHSSDGSFYTDIPNDNEYHPITVNENELPSTNNILQIVRGDIAYKKEVITIPSQISDGLYSLTIQQMTDGSNNVLVCEYTGYSYLPSTKRKLTIYELNDNSVEVIDRQFPEFSRRSNYYCLGMDGTLYGGSFGSEEDSLPDGLWKITSDGEVVKILLPKEIPESMDITFFSCNENSRILLSVVNSKTFATEKGLINCWFKEGKLINTDDNTVIDTGDILVYTTPTEDGENGYADTNLKNVILLNDSVFGLRRNGDIVEISAKDGKLIEVYNAPLKYFPACFFISVDDGYIYFTDYLNVYKMKLGTSLVEILFEVEEFSSPTSNLSQVVRTKDGTFFLVVSTVSGNEWNNQNKRIYNIHKYIPIE